MTDLPDLPPTQSELKPEPAAPEQRTTAKPAAIPVHLEVMPDARPAEDPAKALALVVSENELDPPTALAIQTGFGPVFEQAAKWRQQIALIEITDASQTSEMKLARQLRLSIKEARVSAEKKRKAMKVQAVRLGRAIDGACNIVNYLLEPMEEELLAKEEFAERLEANRKARLRAERAESLRPIGANPDLYQLAEMTDEEFGSLLAGLKVGHEQKLEQDRLAVERRRQDEENQRKKAQEDEAERQRILADNQRLRQEAEDREKAAKDEQDRLAREAAERAVRQLVLREERIAQLEPYGADIEAITQLVDLGAMTQETFDKLMADQKADFEARAREEAERRVEAERRGRLKAEREKQLEPYGVDTSFLVLGEMPDAQFDELLAKSHTDFEAEKTRKAYREELDRQRQAERDRQAEQARRDREARDLAVKLDRDRRAELDRFGGYPVAIDLGALTDEQYLGLLDSCRRSFEEAERLRQDKLRQDEARAAAAAAPDTDKLLALASAIRSLVVPELATEAGQAVLPVLRTQQEKFAAWVDGKARGLTKKKDAGDLFGQEAPK